MENELEFRREWIIGDRNEKGILNEKIDFPEEMPTAFVCNCDETAFRVISALKTKGVCVPEDISVVGFDGIDLCRFTIPRLTTVEQPVEEIARRSVNLLLDMMEKGAAPRHILVKAVFRNRDSVAAPRIFP